MEEEGILDPDDELNLYSLHYIYVPRISRLLEDFKCSWKNHPLRTEKNMTPTQLWTDGFYRIANLVEETSLIDEDYGIDDNGPRPEIKTNNNIHWKMTEITE